ncbi:MAG: 3-hydroxyacyl-ACP dehydratase FabZ [Myxococcales bacterium]|nr:3-hydroxyacyl-ACP dehydratase FabZ [Myxococcales bacterium]
MTVHQIMDILPHRYPFLMIDRVSELDEEHIVAHKNVSFNEPQFNGHFPGDPVMPGVLMVEAMAQAGGLLAHHCGAFNPGKQNLFFMTVDKVKFRKPVRPGDTLDIDVKPLRKGGKIWKLRGEATVRGETVVEGEFMATMVDRENAE